MKVAFETDIKVEELNNIIKLKFADENNRKVNQRGVFSRNSKNRFILNYYNFKGLGNLIYSRTKLMNSFIGTYKKSNNKTIVYGRIYNFKNDIFSLTLFCIISFTLFSLLFKLINGIFIPAFGDNYKFIGITVDYIFSCVIPIIITSMLAYYKYYIIPYKYNKFLIFFIVSMLKCRIINIKE